MYVIVEYVCPSLGVVMANALFAAPVRSLRHAVSCVGRLNDLNPVPWAFMTGNCIGWVAYAYVSDDIFVLSSNAPGLVLSLWLNVGASKLQYLEHHDQRIEKEKRRRHRQRQQQQKQQQTRQRRRKRQRQRQGGQGKEDLDDADDRVRGGVDLYAKDDQYKDEDDDGNVLNPEDEYCDYDIMDDVVEDSRDSEDEDHVPWLLPQERALIIVVAAWIVLLSWVVLGGDDETSSRIRIIIGSAANCNLAFFYAAPLGTVMTVLADKNSASVHRSTLIMTLLNASFWSIYGLCAKHDPFIYATNLVGVGLGIVQVGLCLAFPPPPTYIDECSSVHTASTAGSGSGNHEGGLHNDVNDDGTPIMTEHLIVQV